MASHYVCHPDLFVQPDCSQLGHHPLCAVVTGCVTSSAPCGAHSHLHSDAHFHWLMEVSQRAVLEELCCEVFPLGVLQACPTAFLAHSSLNLHVFAPCLELVSPSSGCTLLYPLRRDVHRIPWSCRAISHGHILASASPCLIPPRILPLATRNRAATANFITSPWYGFSKQSSNAVFLLPST